ncbi:hypothetical protein HUS96_20770, partial [Pseudomonas protegens]|nr:hypothetical protein [Pseudomonas protegens]
GLYSARLFDDTTTLADAAEVQACREDCRTLQRLSEDLARQVGGFKLH